VRSSYEGIFAVTVQPTSAHAAHAAEAKRRLRAAFGEQRVRDGDSERDLHGADFSFHEPHRPDFVFYPSSTEDVSRVLAIANELNVPVTPFGAGTSLEGHVIPVRGGISLDLTQMDGIIEVSPANMTATVQAGVTRLTLDRAARDHGLTFPVDPGADATLGGMAATNAAGTTTIRYGKMRPNILALEAVLADGTVIRTGSRSAKTSAGYDLTGLLVGSEGTLAVITELTLRLYPIPEFVVAMRITLADIESACQMAIRVVGVGVTVARVELIDAWMVSAINAYSDTLYPEQSSLFMELAGSEPTVSEDLEIVKALAEEAGALDIAVESRTEERSRLWKARHDATHAAAAKMPGRKERTTDICVSLTELAAAIHYAHTEIDRLGLHAGIVGHAGDANVHVAVFVDPEDADEIARSDEFIHNIVHDALARGGTCTGEHGIGQGKLEALQQEHADLIPLMNAIKDSFDPNHILNPGKVLARTDGWATTASASSVA
jgi:D-lactate dehydrogenase (cytochrome)